MALRRQNKVTIKDIAKMCNVSTQTVSRVLNNRPDVAPETRAAVEKAMAAVAYQPSALARSLVQQHSSTIGVIVAGLRYIGVSHTLNGIIEACEAHGYAVLLKELPRFDMPDIVPVIESLITRHVDGIIFAAPQLNDNIKIIQAKLPLTAPPIVFLKSTPHPRYTTIGIDNYAGARAAVDHLLALGRREIGFIGGPPEWLEAQQRFAGWRDALHDAGQPIAEHQWSTGNWSSASGEAACAALLRTYPAMDALFAGNDQMALGVLHHAAAHGIAVPDALAVIGFDDAAESAFFTPALTTVRHPLRELGTLAVQRLLAQIDDPEAHNHDRAIMLPTELIVRDSTPRVNRHVGSAVHHPGA